MAVRVRFPSGAHQSLLEEILRGIFVLPLSSVLSFVTPWPLTCIKTSKVSPFSAFFKDFPYTLDAF